jgi:hypothetical protein
VSDGTRTRDRLDHNQELYQLSYAHHGVLRVTWYAASAGAAEAAPRSEPELVAEAAGSTAAELAQR